MQAHVHVHTHTEQGRGSPFPLYYLAFLALQKVLVGLWFQASL